MIIVRGFSNKIGALEHQQLALTPNNSVREAAYRDERGEEWVDDTQPAPLTLPGAEKKYQLRGEDAPPCQRRPR